MNEKNRNMARSVIFIALRRMIQIERELRKEDCRNTRELVKELKQIANLILRIEHLVRPVTWNSFELYEDE